jgi:hypothetical protein
MLALSIPGVALAANTAAFSGATPKAGSNTTAYRPTVSIVVYDKYGVSGRGSVATYLDGHATHSTQTRYTGWGLRKMKFVFGVEADLSIGSHTASIRIHDLKHKTSTYTWSFNVPDLTAPVTTSDAVLNYIGSATIHLSRSDNVGVTHTYYKLDGGATTEGTTITTSGLGFHMIQFWSVDAAGNVEAPNMAFFTVNRTIATAHALPTGLICTSSGCHDTDLPSIHGGQCYMCHTVGGPAPSNNCVTCHGAQGPHGEHIAIPSDTQPSCTQSTCHGTDAVTIHPTCATCHASTSELVAGVIHAGLGSNPTLATCEDCHPAGYAAIHAAGNGQHTATGQAACFNDLCHSTDVTVIHASWIAPPGCAACHASGKTPSTSCTPCHAAPHSGEAAAHAVTLAAGCTGATCHSNDRSLADEHAVYGIRCIDCHASTDARVVAAITGGVNTCVACHSGTGSNPNLKPGHASDFTAADTASGHNVPGVDIGAKTKFDGTQGVLLKDTLENTVTTTWAFPEVNVFWASNAISTGEAPATAIVGLNKDSVISCDDCHDPATGIQATGPHGSTQKWAIDPNYPAPYKYATLGVRKGTTEDTSTSGIKFNTLMSDAPGRTLMIGEATTGPLPLLQTYRNQGNFPAVLADGTKGEHAVICAKCHDLYNAGTGCDGWSNAYSEQSTPGALPVLDAPSPESIHGMHAGGTTVDTQIRLDQRGGNQGRTDGRGDCVNCHIAIPHGWQRPRLLVNGYTGPYTTDSGVAQSVADPFPYWQGVGQYIAPGDSPGNGPIDAKEDHQLNVQGVPVWSEQRCISCSNGAFYETGGAEENGLEHGGFPSVPAKLK